MRGVKARRIARDDPKCSVAISIKRGDLAATVAEGMTIGRRTQALEPASGSPHLPPRQQRRNDFPNRAAVDIARSWTPESPAVSTVLAGAVRTPSMPPSRAARPLENRDCGVPLDVDPPKGASTWPPRSAAILPRYEPASRARRRRLPRRGGLGRISRLDPPRRPGRRLGASAWSRATIGRTGSCPSLSPEAGQVCGDWGAAAVDRWIGDRRRARGQARFGERRSAMKWLNGRCPLCGSRAWRRLSRTAPRTAPRSLRSC